MRLNRYDADMWIGSRGIHVRPSEEWLVGNVIKFPDDGRIVRFGRAEGIDESATIIILPVIRVERYADALADDAAPEPRTNPPAASGGRRRMRRR